MIGEISGEQYDDYSWLKEKLGDRMDLPKISAVTIFRNVYGMTGY